MRITSGILKGVSVPSLRYDHLHPMSERMRSALFNTLGDISGMSFIDAFAGTGLIGFEALSRGANSVVAIEKNDAAYMYLLKNSSMVLKGRGSLEWKGIHSGVAQFCKDYKETRADIVIMDPPYDYLQINAVLALFSHANKLVVLSWPVDEPLPDVSDIPFEMIKHASYAGGSLVFYRRIKRDTV
jgi:16S rRNA (guanine966-N2)-methyltransferase